MNADHRYRDPLVLVRCPACEGYALVLSNLGPADQGDGPLEAKRSLRCGTCGHHADTYSRMQTSGGSIDPYFRQPLWLQMGCCGEILWAYNAGHLDLLESYVGARLRERGLDRRWSSLVERLPSWIKSAKNRAEILRCIGRLRSAMPPTRQ